MVTGKCKKDFEMWLTNKMPFFFQTSRGYLTGIGGFYTLPKSMQYGVYANFFDSVNLIIEVQELDKEWIYFVNNNSYGIEWNLKNRNESRTQAISKANEIYNNK